MKIRLFDFEGTAEELGQVPELREALRNLGSGGESDDDDVGDDDTGVAADRPPGPGELPKDVADFIAVRAGNAARAIAVGQWVTEVLDWGSTEVEFGRSRTSGDGLNNYLMLYAKGPRRFGAFAYVVPGRSKVMLRLVANDAEGCDQATIRNVKQGTGYEVTFTLDSPEAHEQAITLAKMALERVQT